MSTDILSGRRKKASAPRSFALLATLLLLPLAACDDGQVGPLDRPTVQVMITDAPSDVVASAEIWVSQIYLQPGPEDDDDLDDDGVDDGEDEDVPGRVFLFDDPENPRNFDLLLLRDGVVEVLTEEVEVDPAEYGQLRLVVDSAFVTLDEEFTFEDGSTTMSLKVPSGSTSGIKVNLQRPIEADEGDEIEILVDMDVDENFVLQGSATSPAGIKGMLFTPTLGEMSRTENGDDEDENGEA